MFGKYQHVLRATEYRCQIIQGKQTFKERRKRPEITCQLVSLIPLPLPLASNPGTRYQGLQGPLAPGRFNVQMFKCPVRSSSLPSSLSTKHVPLMPLHGGVVRPPSKSKSKSKSHHHNLELFDFFLSLFRFLRTVNARHTVWA